MTERSEVTQSIPELLPDVPAAAQIQACQRSVKNLCAIMPNVSGPMHHVRSLQLDLDELVVGNNLNSLTALTAAQIIRSTVGAVDLAITNEMDRGVESVIHNSPGKASYMRTAVITGENADFRLPFTPAAYFFMHLNELQAQLERVDESVRKTKSPTVMSRELRAGKDSRILYNGFVSNDQAKAIDQKLKGVVPVDDTTAIAIVPFRLDQKNAGVMVYGKMKKYERVFEPQSGLPRQAIWQALLAKGICLFPVDQVIKNNIGDQPSAQQFRGADLTPHFRQSFGSVDHDQSRSDARARRKSAVWIRDGGMSSEYFLANHEYFYGQQYGREHSIHGRETTMITRSGVSANEVAIKGIGEILKRTGLEKPKLNVVQGWYNESFFSLLSDFEPAVMDDSQVFMVNHEPNYANYIPHKFYPLELISYIQLVIQRAEENPDKPFFLVVDKTTNLNYQTFRPSDDMPRNLTVIETASLTKHQRDSKKHFFGLFQHWGLPADAAVFKEMLPIARGELTDLAMVHVPRISAHEIERNRAALVAKRKAFVAGFEKRQVHVPEDLRWQLEPYSYFTYVVPPYRLLLSLFVRNGFVLGDAQKEFPKFLLGLNRDAESLLRALDEHLQTDDIKVAGSFGLNDTRVGMVQGHLSCAGKIVPQRVLRVSYGLQTSEEVLSSFGGYLYEFVNFLKKE